MIACAILFALPIQCASIHVAIDLGTFATKSSTYESTENPVIAQNLHSKRTTPTFIAFKADPSFNPFSNESVSREEAALLHPVIGERAISYMEYRPWMGAGFLPLFLDSDESKTKLIVSEFSTNSSAARVSYSDLLALFFRQYLQAVSGGQKVKSVTVTVPSEYTIPQRRIIERAILSSGNKFSGIIDDVESIINIYGLEKVGKFSNSPKIILFVDIGATSVKAFAVNFSLAKDKSGTKGYVKADRLSYSIDYTDGSAFLTANIANFISKRLNLASITDSEKIRLFSAAEKLKVQLTLSSEASVQFETADGSDKTVKMTREELNELSETLTNKIIDTAKAASKGHDFAELEIIGGGSRSPFIQEKLMSGMNLTNLGKSLNGEEVYAIGAGYASQYLNGLCRFSQMRISDLYRKCKVNLTDGISNIEVNESVYSFPGSTENLTFVYESPKSGLLNDRFSYSLTPNGNRTLMVRLKSSPIDIMYAKLCNGSDCAIVRHEPLPRIFAASPAYYAIVESVEAEQRVGKLRSNLEQLSSRILEEIEYNNTVIRFTNASQRQAIHNEASKAKEWLQGESMNETEIKKMHTGIINVITPIYRRIYENESLTTSFTYLLMAVEKAHYFIYLEQPINRSWINSSEMEKFGEIANETESWLTYALNVTTGHKLWEDYKITSREVDMHTKKLYSEYLRLSSIPPPKKETVKRAFGGFLKSLKKIPSMLFGKKKNSTSEL